MRPNRSAGCATARPASIPSGTGNRGPATLSSFTNRLDWFAVRSPDQASLHPAVPCIDRQTGRYAMKETLRLEEYPFTIRPLGDDDGGGYLIEFPDILGCMSDGETPEEAIVNGRDALRCCLPHTQGIWRADSRARHVCRRQRPVEATSSQDTSRTLGRAGRREGVSLNTLVTAMIAEGLGSRQSRRRRAS